MFAGARYRESRHLHRHDQPSEPRATTKYQDCRPGWLELQIECCPRSALCRCAGAGYEPAGARATKRSFAKTKDQNRPTEHPQEHPRRAALSCADDCHGFGGLRCAVRITEPGPGAPARELVAWYLCARGCTLLSAGCDTDMMGPRRRDDRGTMHQIYRPDMDVRVYYASKIIGTGVSQRSESRRSSRDQSTHDTFGKDIVLDFSYFSRRRAA